MLISAFPGSDVLDCQVTEIPYQPETPAKGNLQGAEPSQKVRHERREKTWLGDC